MPVTVSNKPLSSRLRATSHVLSGHREFECGTGAIEVVLHGLKNHLEFGGFERFYRINYCPFDSDLRRLPTSLELVESKVEHAASFHGFSLCTRVIVEVNYAYCMFSLL